MAISIYDLSVPVYTKMLPAIGHLLRKAEADAETRKIDPQVFLKARLAPDMFDLTRQVQICTDHVKGSLSRLAGVETPSWPDDEDSFAALHARLDKTLDYAKSFEPGQLEGSETRTIELKFPQGSLTFDGLDYLTGFALPNFYFHMTTAYDILRHNGVPVGKRDFFGG
jgi:hypothetical protein